MFSFAGWGFDRLKQLHVRSSFGSLRNTAQEQEASDIRLRGYKLFSCSNQLSMNFFLLINVNKPIIDGILTFMSGKIAFLAYLGLKKAEFLDIFILMSI